MSANKGTKRKRTQNTSQEQHEMYISYMENDYVFKSNTINPTLDPNYLDDKWKELSLKLNGIGKGPVLTAEEWKKRFADWKYATKTKFRKIKEHSMRTGSGPKLGVEMTPVEERALAVWGKVTVTGANVTEYEGIEVTEPPEPEPDANVQNEHESSYIFEDENVYQVLNPSIQQENVIHQEQSEQTTSFHDTTQEPNTNIRTIIESEKTYGESENSQKYQQRGVRRRPKPLSLLAENLIKSSESATFANTDLNNTVKSFCDQYIELEKEKVAIKKEKMKFKISKFKFLNKDFEF